MSIVKIKRSPTTGSPPSLAQGEIAYSYLEGTLSNGGDRLYIGTGMESGGSAANIEVIGGKYFTQMLDHTHGQIVPNSAIIVDTDNKINELDIDNLNFNGNTIRSTNLNGDITIDPAGTGRVLINGAIEFLSTVSLSNDITFSSIAVQNLTPGRVVVVDANDQLTDFNGLRYNSTNFTVIANTSITGNLTVSNGNVSLPNLTIAGYTPNRFLSVGAGGRITDNFLIENASGQIVIRSPVSIDGDLSLTANKSITTEDIIVKGLTQNRLLIANSTGTLQGITSGTTINLDGIINFSNIVNATSNTNLSNLNVSGASDFDGSVSMGNIRISDNTITVLNVNGNINLSPNGIGNIVVNNSRISGVSNPVANSDVVTRGFLQNSFSATLSFAGDTGNDDISIRSQTLTFTGGTGITTIAGSNRITFALANTAVTSGSYGNSSRIPIITVDKQGRITAVTESQIATELSVAGDTGSDTVELNGGTLTFTGGTGISTVANNDVITFAIGQSVSVTDNITFNDGQFTGDITVDGNLTVNGSTDLINVNTINVEDPLIYLGANNSSDIVDLGFMAEYNENSTSKFTGVFRDATNSEWYFFENYEQANTSVNVIDRADSSFQLSTVNINRLRVSGFNIRMTGDVMGSVPVSLLGGADLNINTTIQPNSVQLGQDTTGSYVQNITAVAGSGIIVEGNAGESATLNIRGINASNTVKGVAQFDSSNFNTAVGVISISAVDGGTY